MSGSLVCVGVGMTLGAHISPISRSHIEQADKVFMLMSDGFVESWVSNMNPNSVSLQPFYEEGKRRQNTYEEMADLLVREASEGKKVVAAFYGHPGVFACVAHKALAKTEALGIFGKMEAGISAEDCLFADLGIDPGKTGCIHYEASQFMFYKRNIDTAAHLILWQIGFAGDQSHTKFSVPQEYKSLLKELLLNKYPADHEVILYEANVLPTQEIRKDKVKLSELDQHAFNMQTTLVIPPSTKMIENPHIREVLDNIDKNATKPILTLVN